MNVGRFCADVSAMSKQKGATSFRIGIFTGAPGKDVVPKEAGHVDLVSHRNKQNGSLKSVIHAKAFGLTFNGNFILVFYFPSRLM